ncbi:MAG: nuclear transport factor 2 family protein [Acidobacteriia bacterium]|nr:nuclear transport factor 2 family protein [Terriglobia bacterium]
MKRKAITAAVLSLGLLALVTVRAQQKKAPALTGTDYFEIQQLMFRYGQAIDTCSNNGYDYADLFTPDGTFTDNFTEEGYKKGGLMRAKGREQLAAAAGGGRLGCKDVGWKDWSHLMINPVITATSGGAKGRVYLVAIGEKGPRDVTRFGGYEDVYVKTASGWRIQSRTHVRNKAWSNPLLQTPDLN